MSDPDWADPINAHFCAQITPDPTIRIAPNKKHIKDKSQFQLGSQNEPELTDQQRTAELESSTNQKYTKCKNAQK